MTESEQKTLLKSMTGEESDELLQAYLNLAKQEVLNRMYPFGGGDSVPDKYSHIVLKIAAYMLNKRGAEGEVSHSENGVSVGYESGDIPESILRGIVPMCGVI